MCATGHRSFYDSTRHLVRDLSAGGTRIFLEFEYRRVFCHSCQAVKRETLAWLADSHRFTKRFELEIGRQCQEMSVARVATMHRLSWDQVRRMEMTYLRMVVDQHPPSAHLRVIGIDEVSIHKGQRYAIVVADLDQMRPIWVGFGGRAKEHLDAFFQAIGPRRTARIKLAVMDMWQPFRQSLLGQAPQAQIVYDKFHVLRHLSDALDQVRRSEYRRVQGKERRYIKGQRYTLLSHRANLDLEGRRALRLLLQANQRLHKAYLLKESFGQLWDYRHAAWSRKFFEHWKEQLRWSRLQPFQQFAAMIERHWDGIVSYCHPDNKVSLGFMEGLNNKIRVIQRRAYGIRDQEYLRLKILASFIPDG